MKKSIPLFFYPTYKIMLDDDKAFTQSILLKMYSKKFKEMGTINETLTWLKENHRIKKKDEETSILFIDYHMPEMTGLDFLGKIKDIPIKKVLVTSETDYTIAINAFNNGLIDAYIKKDDPDFLTKLQAVTEELEWKYFTDLNAVTHDIRELDYLSNPSVINYFMTFMQDKNITEFYLIDKQGTFCTYNTAGEKEYLVLRNIEQMQQLSLFGAEDGATDKIINDLTTGKVIPFFNFKEHWEIPASEWTPYMHTAEKLPGDERYVYAVVKCQST